MDTYYRRLRDIRTKYPAETWSHAFDVAEGPNGSARLRCLLCSQEIKWGYPVEEIMQAHVQRCQQSQDFGPSRVSRDPRLLTVRPETNASPPATALIQHSTSTSSSSSSSESESSDGSPKGNDKVHKPSLIAAANGAHTVVYKKELTQGEYNAQNIYVRAEYGKQINNVPIAGRLVRCLDDAEKIWTFYLRRNGQSAYYLCRLGDYMRTYRLKPGHELSLRWLTGLEGELWQVSHSSADGLDSSSKERRQIHRHVSLHRRKNLVPVRNQQFPLPIRETKSKEASQRHPMNVTCANGPVKRTREDMEDDIDGLELGPSVLPERHVRTYHDVTLQSPAGNETKILEGQGMKSMRELQEENNRLTLMVRVAELEKKLVEQKMESLKREMEVRIQLEVAKARLES